MQIEGPQEDRDLRAPTLNRGRQFGRLRHRKAACHNHFQEKLCLTVNLKLRLSRGQYP